MVIFIIIIIIIMASLYAALRASAAAATLALASAATATKVDLSSYSDAKALDGSPYAIYFRPGAGAAAANFLLHFQGGGFCTALDVPSLGTTSCASRANNLLGSSLKWPATCCGASDGGLPISSGGVLSDDPAINPATHDWNTVYLPYGDGSSFSSYVAEPLNVTTRNANGNQIWMRGRANLDAALDYLIKRKGMGTADTVSGPGSRVFCAMEA